VKKNNLSYLGAELLKIEFTTNYLKWGNAVVSIEKGMIFDLNQEYKFFDESPFVEESEICTGLIFMVFGTSMGIQQLEWVKEESFLSKILKIKGVMEHREIPSHLIVQFGMESGYSIFKIYYLHKPQRQQIENLRLQQIQDMQPKDSILGKMILGKTII
jgi:hypothetical protein